jgi:hypothetical protein
MRRSFCPPSCRVFTPYFRLYRICRRPAQNAAPVDWHKRGETQTCLASSEAFFLARLQRDRSRQAARMRVLTRRQSSSIACHSTLTLLDFVRSLERFAVTSARYKRETNPAAWSFALASVPFASTAEVVSSEVARNSGLAQVRATARLVQSILTTATARCGSKSITST